MVKEYLKNLIMIVFGCLIMAIGTSMFLLPNKFSTGGVTGISTIIYYLFNIPVGTFTLILNIPILIFTFFRLWKTILINSLDSDKFLTSEETINVNSKKIKAKKFTYLLDKENMERTINYIREEMIKDEELMEALSHIIGLSTSELEDALTEEIDYSNYEDIYINLYTNGGTKVIAGNIGTKEEAVIRFTNQDDIFNMFIGDEYTNFTIKNENNITDIAYNEYDEEIFALTITWEEETRKLELTMDDYGDELNMIIEVSNMKYSKNSISEDIVLKYNMNSYGEEISFELAGNLEITKEELESIDVENSVNINTLNEEETQLIYDNLMNVLDKLNLSNYFEI